MAFPNNIDTFIQAQDITQADITNLNGYQSAMSNGNFALASQYLSAMSNANQKQFNASRFNTLLSVISNIETFYLSLNGVRAYINNEITKYTDIAQWSGTTAYAVNNMAIYNNIWYICIQANTNQNPSATTGYWNVLIVPQEAKQYYIGSNPPVTASTGTIVFNTNI